MTSHKYFTRSKILKSNQNDILPTCHKYNTRYKKKQTLRFTIDFDDASKQWRKNKQYLGNGCFQYKC